LGEEEEKEEGEEMNPEIDRQLVGFLPMLLLGVLLPVGIIPVWRIFSRLGHNGALSLLMPFPVVNLIVLYYVAFSKTRPAR
jgi:hypothetical protein